MERSQLQQMTVAKLVLFLVILQGCPSHCQRQTPPKLTQQPSKSIYYFSNSDQPNFALPCQANGTQPLHYRWERNGVPIDQTGSTGNLTVDAATENDIGNYTCFVSNDYGTAVSKTAQVQLAYLRPFVEIEPPSISTDEGSPVVLQCGAPAGDPPPRIHWTRQDRTLLFNDGSSWDRDQGVAQDQDGNLVFLNPSMRNNGAYVCKASSFAVPRRIYFSVDKTVVVREAGEISPSPPTIRESPRNVQALRGENVKMYCLATGNPTPTVTWTRQDDPAFRDEGPVLSLSNVQLEDAGSYICTASSEGHDDVDETTDLRVASAPYWIEKPGDVSVKREGDTSLSCEAGGQPVPRIVWMENGQPIEGNDGKRSVELNDVTEAKVYQCLASNAHGRIIANAIVSVTEIGEISPSPPEKGEPADNSPRNSAPGITTSVLLLPILVTFYLR